MSDDALRRLQAAARDYARLVHPGSSPRRVIILDDHRERIAEVRVPCECAPVPVPTFEPEVRPGWYFPPKGPPLFDGDPRPELKGRLLGVLRILAESDGVVGVDQLRPAWPDYKCEEKTIRNAVIELRNLLKVLWPHWEGDTITATGSGYRLEVR